MNAFKVTYTDGTSYETNANGTAEEFKAYLTQCGPIVDENPVTWTTEAQRKLIAAAPALLEALEAADKAMTAANVIIQHNRPDGQIAHDLLKAIDTARAAIAKVTGE